MTKSFGSRQNPQLHNYNWSYYRFQIGSDSSGLGLRFGFGRFKSDPETKNIRYPPPQKSYIWSKRVRLNFEMFFVALNIKNQWSCIFSFSAALKASSQLHNTREKLWVAHKLQLKGLDQCYQLLTDWVTISRTIKPCRRVAKFKISFRDIND